MKKVIQLLNSLDKIETSTLSEKAIKNRGMDAMLTMARKMYDEFEINYKPGKGFASCLKKYSSISYKLTEKAI